MALAIDTSSSVTCRVASRSERHCHFWQKGDNHGQFCKTTARKGNIGVHLRHDLHSIGLYPFPFMLTGPASGLSPTPIEVSHDGPVTGHLCFQKLVFADLCPALTAWRICVLQEVLAYYQRRLKRIAPAYYVTVALISLIKAWPEGDPSTAAARMKMNYTMGRPRSASDLSACALKPVNLKSRK